MESPRPLRILCVVNLPWDRKLGASRVWLELAEEWRAAGHRVDHYSLTEAFPRHSPWSVVRALRQIRFARRAARYVRRNAQRYDIIDSLLGTLPFSKKSLRFQGLLVARSVGFYHLYEQFDIFAQKRWPDLSRGKLIGRVLYTLIKKKMHKAAEDAVRHADLLNLANHDELICLREELKSTKPAIVQPYGLTDRRRQALREAAEPAEARLARKKISFIGMWSVRKGAMDWAEIIRAIRNEVPTAAFAFLGTLTEDEKVLEHLQLTKTDSVELVKEFEPEALPGLLRDSTLGIFPSYVEGFGFGTLEQLAAGIPTVAYDVPGPRQILNSAGQTALTAAGDIRALAAQAIRILREELSSYARLREQSLAIAARFSWPEIARQTLDAYRVALRRTRGGIFFTHPFGLRSASGGSRIMRALLQDAPMPFISVCTAPQTPPPTPFGTELHFPLRPSFGRIERTRFAGLPEMLTPLFARRFSRRLKKSCLQFEAEGIHSIAHGGMDFYSAYLVANDLDIPFFLQVHDDFIYSARGLRSEAAHVALRDAWQNAAARFVICDQLGAEYCRRYGMRDYVVITDGLERVAADAKRRTSRDLRIYFMGLFHLGYEENLKVLLKALTLLEEKGYSGKLSIKLRCGGIRPRLVKDYERFVRILPFASEREVARDMEEADLLYLPLPFEKRYELFVRFSLSTKMVTYIGSGIPIVYHGPRDSAVHDLLKRNNAALLCTVNDSAVLAATLEQYLNDESMAIDSAVDALDLARKAFLLRDIRQKFWDTIGHSIAAN